MLYLLLVLFSLRFAGCSKAAAVSVMPSLFFSAFVPFFLTLVLLSLLILIPRSGGKSGSNKKADGVKVSDRLLYIHFVCEFVLMSVNFTKLILNNHQDF